MVDTETLQAAARKLAAKFSPERIILFGSQARGEADERSDVDLLVITPIRGSRRAMMVAMDRELRGSGFARDIIILTPDEFERDRDIPGTVARPAWKEGVVLYARH
ncbi:nucleotidyltransferase domain-containing protein [Geoalkalibacter halelectricus]|uniref:Nucleotidyltransferase domain-containing protein n=1 Tax=Geoalkalibacter halelectricus TaxID=2847045 RepID=A0ABY5ZR38_9BACT|nr:nucleotidyltransferase domain-containing protein [Geoalkalibacter halelectricus]MDO3377956.1 nucleotidyltransferase domain-containing protein [Geoalkalibacter halelectricus]UWZ81541.1 nucleotidyltransferase domain-containing protein [Geoalkalibacter halelectricus]